MNSNWPITVHTISQTFLIIIFITRTTLNFYIWQDVMFLISEIYYTNYPKFLHTCMQDVMFLISETKLMYLHVVFVGGCYKGWPLSFHLTKLPSHFVQAWMYMFFKIELLYSRDVLHNVHCMFSGLSLLLFKC